VGLFYGCSLIWAANRGPIENPLTGHILAGDFIAGSLVVAKLEGDVTVFVRA